MIISGGGSEGNIFGFNSLWPSDVIWRHGSTGRSTLAQVMACCLTAPSHYLNQCWLMISEVLWYSPDSHSTENTSYLLLKWVWNLLFETVVKSPRGQWVNLIVGYATLASITEAAILVPYHCQVTATLQMPDLQMSCKHFTLHDRVYPC